MSCHDPIGCSREGYCSCDKVAPVGSSNPKPNLGPMVPDLGIKIPPLQGWICPKCDSVWSPTVPGCFTCNKS